MSNLIEILTDQFTDARIFEANAFLAQSMAGGELEFDTLDATLDLSVYRPVALSPTDADVLCDSDSEVLTVHPWVRLLVTDPGSYQPGDQIKAYHDEQLVGKFYFESIRRVGKFMWSVRAISPVGVLDKSTHYGGIYGVGATFSTVLADIIGGIVPYSINPALAAVQVRGWLPVATRRENLHQLLFAMGACIQKDAEGDIYVTYLPSLEQALLEELPDSRIYAGGSVEYPDHAAGVVLYEHQYVGSNAVETVQLFSGDVPSETVVAPNGTTYLGAMLIFDEPYRSYAVDGTTVLASGANYVILSPANGVTLTGKPYLHSTRRLVAGDVEGESVVTFEDATLVNPLNAAAVLERLESYYAHANKVTMDIVVEAERAGDGVAFDDPFGDPAEGYIESLGLAMSGIVRGTAQIATNYDPASGNTYNNVDIRPLSGLSSWTIPAGVTEIRVVLIGQGSAGKTGGYGDDGEEGSSRGYGRGGAGGEAGEGGKGGYINIIDLEVAPGESLIFGGTANRPTVTYNGVTYRAYDGRRSEIGYTDLIYGHVFGLPGQPGIAGGAADPDGEIISFGGSDYGPGDKGNNGSWEA